MIHIILENLVDPLQIDDQWEKVPASRLHPTHDVGALQTPSNGEVSSSMKK